MSHETSMHSYITEAARDIRGDYSADWLAEMSIEDNELDNMVEAHRVAGDQQPENARGIKTANHDLYEHCDTCCRLFECEGE